MNKFIFTLQVYKKRKSIRRSFMEMWRFVPTSSANEY